MIRSAQTSPTGLQLKSAALSPKSSCENHICTVRTFSSNLGIIVNSAVFNGLQWNGFAFHAKRLALNQAAFQAI